CFGICELPDLAGEITSGRQASFASIVEKAFECAGPPGDQATSYCGLCAADHHASFDQLREACVQIRRFGCCWADHYGRVALDRDPMAFVDPANDRREFGRERVQQVGAPHRSNNDQSGQGGEVSGWITIALAE